MCSNDFVDFIDFNKTFQNSGDMLSCFTRIAFSAHVIDIKIACVENVSINVNCVYRIRFAIFFYVIVFLTIVTLRYRANFNEAFAKFDFVIFHQIFE